MDTISPRILLVSGPNLKMLGKRETEIYGTETLEEIEGWIIREGGSLGVDVHCFQSDSEGELIRHLHEQGVDAHGVIINPGALAHYSIALRDAICCLECPVIEVHITNIYKREEFRQKSIIAPVCVGQVVGLGKWGYHVALLYLVEIMRQKGLIPSPSSP